jgi:hypothetical protein
MLLRKARTLKLRGKNFKSAEAKHQQVNVNMYVKRRQFKELMCYDVPFPFSSLSTSSTLRVILSLSFTSTVP